MSDAIVKNEDQRTQRKIYVILTNLMSLSNVEVAKCMGNTDYLSITHKQTYMPDFNLVWCKNKKHFKIHILVGSIRHDKENAGYHICAIQNGLDATAFVMFYSFLHKHQDNTETTDK